MQRKGAAGLKRWHVGRVPAGWPQPAPKEMMQPCLVYLHLIYLVARTSPHRAMRLLAISRHQRDDATLSTAVVYQHVMSLVAPTSPPLPAGRAAEGPVGGREGRAAGADLRAAGDAQ